MGDGRFKRNNRHENLVFQVVTVNSGVLVHSVIHGHRALRDYGSGPYQRGEWNWRGLHGWWSLDVC